MSSVVYGKRDHLYWEGAKKLIRSLPSDKISTMSPRNTFKKNEVYVYEVMSDTRSPFWQKDGYRWKCRRTNKLPRKSSYKECRQLEFQMFVSGKFVDFYRKEFWPIDSQIEPPNAWNCPYVVVHYYGSSTVLKEATLHGTASPHGNKKSTPEKAVARFLDQLLSVSSGTQLQKLNETPTARAGTYASNVRQTARKSTGGRRVKKLVFGNTSEMLDIAFNGITEEVTGDTSLSVFPSLNKETTQMEAGRCDTGPSEPMNVEDVESEEEWNTAEPEGTGYPTYVPTDKSVLKQMRKGLEADQTPLEIYNKTERNNILKYGDEDPSLLPRNPKQVYNLKYKLKQEQMHDDIYEVYRFSKEHPNYIPRVGLCPDFYFVQVNPKLNDHINALLKKGFQLVFYYDTTFDVGQVYTSILSMSHPLFKETPIIPVAVLFHESANTDCHEDFFRTLAKCIELNAANCVIVTDREQAIKIAITSTLQNANHVYCWNHIIRNVKDWVRANISKDAEVVRLYMEQLRNMLHAASSEEREAMLVEYGTQWTENFKKYYHDFVKSAVERSSRPFLEELGIYHPMSGITNNPAESANAIFKRKIKTKARSFYQLLSRWFFHQTDALFDICRGLKSQGRFSPIHPLPANLSLPTVIKTIEDPEVVDAMIQEGKYPKTVAVNPKYKSVSLFETTTMRGLAKCLVAHNCVKFLHDQKVFVVGGLQLDDASYMVDLAKMSCTCLRQSSCTHLLAVHIYLGLERRIPLKRCQPNMGTLYQKTVKKYVGMKKGLGRRRLRIPTAAVQNATRKKKSLVDVSATLVASENHNNISSGNTNLKLSTLDRMKEGPVLDAISVVLPRLTLKNWKDVCLVLPTGIINLADLKTLQPSITATEERVLRKLLQLSHGVSTHWLIDNVIAGVFLRIVDLKSTKNISITPAQASEIFRKNDTRLMFTRNGNNAIDFCDWKTIERVFIPRNIRGDHWILLVLLPRHKTIQILDPEGLYRISEADAGSLCNVFNIKFEFGRRDEWKLEYPQIALSKEDTAYQCGPYICFYAEAIMCGWSLEKMPRIDAYRSHLLATVISSCKFGRHADKSEQVPGIICNFCKTGLRPDATPVYIRGEKYFICLS